MAILKKIKAATLMETLIATVLIMVIFIVASLILNNMFSSSIKSKTRGISAQLNEIEYLYINDKITLPFYDDFDGWEIAVEQVNNSKNVNIIATKNNTENSIEKTIFKK